MSPFLGTLCFQPLGFPLYELSQVRGGDEGIRTHDPLLAKQVLSQLSYTPALPTKVPILSYRRVGTL